MEKQGREIVSKRWGVKLRDSEADRQQDRKMERNK